MKISGVIIAYNEEGCIERCIKSMLAVVDEILVVDSYSTDNTPQICKKLGVRFIQNTFEGHIQQKNFAMSQSKFDWILSLDADESLTEELQQQILQVKHQESQLYDGFWINRLNSYCGQWLYYGGWYPDRKIRLWNKQKGKWEGKNPHDFIVMHSSAKEAKLKGDILHYTYANLKDHIYQCENFAQIGSSAALQAGIKTNFLMIYIKPAMKFIGDYIFKRGFLDGKNGFRAAKYSAYEKYLRYKLIYKGQK